MSLRAGKLHHQVTLQAQAVAADSVAQAQPNYATLGTTPTMWAGIEPATGEKHFTSEEVQIQATHKLTLRYRGDLSGTMRALYADPGTLTSVSAPIAAGQQAVTPGSMANIAVGTLLQIDTTGSGVQEFVTVTAVSGSTFTATFAHSHLGGAPIWRARVFNFLETPRSPEEERECLEVMCSERSA